MLLLCRLRIFSFLFSLIITSSRSLEQDLNSYDKQAENGGFSEYYLINSISVSSNQTGFESNVGLDNLLAFFLFFDLASQQMLDGWKNSQENLRKIDLLVGFYFCFPFLLSLVHHL